MIKGWPNPYSLERTINHTGLLLITVKDYLCVKVYCLLVRELLLYHKQDYYDQDNDNF